MKNITVISIALLAGTLSAALSAGDPEAGKAKSAVCAACHGPNGVSPNPLYPNLAGQSQPYLMNALKAYKTGDRKEPTMSAMTAPLSDSDIENLAAYYSSQSCK